MLASVYGGNIQTNLKSIPLHNFADAGFDEFQPIEQRLSQTRCLAIFFHGNGSRAANKIGAGTLGRLPVVVTQQTAQTSPLGAPVRCMSGGCIERRKPLRTKPNL